MNGLKQRVDYGDGFGLKNRVIVGTPAEEGSDDFLIFFVGLLSTPGPLEGALRFFSGERTALVLGIGELWKESSTLSDGVGVAPAFLISSSLSVTSVMLGGGDSSFLVILSEGDRTVAVED